MLYFSLNKIYLLIDNFQKSKERYNKKILGERIARLCGGIAIIQVPHTYLVHYSNPSIWAFYGGPYHPIPLLEKNQYERI
jgi:hypothetical protein